MHPLIDTLCNVIHNNADRKIKKLENIIEDLMETAECQHYDEYKGCCESKFKDKEKWCIVCKIRDRTK